MNTIIIHIFPHEIDNYKRVVNQILNVCCSNNIYDIKIDSILNINDDVIKNNDNIINVMREYNKTNNRSSHITSSITNEYFGVNEHRRECIEKASPHDCLILLDVDLYFNDNTITDMLGASEIIKRDNLNYIITPQLVRLWDTTWDCLVNQLYLKNPTGMCENLDIQKILKTNHGDSRITKCPKFKWAGGWFTCISARLAKYIGIPKSFVGYGPDDTYMMYCCDYMKENGIPVQQFILENNVVCEDRTLIKHNKKNFKINNFRKKSEMLLNSEYNNFKKRINQDIYKNNES